MRLAGFILILTSISALAQPKPLFKIISCSEGVTVDGVEAKPGEIIFSNSKKLNIPKGGYAGVITLDGYAYQLLRGISVKEVPSNVKYNVESRFRPKGAVNRSMPKSFEIAGFMSNEFSEIYGDSILIAFKSYYKIKPPFKVTFISMYEETIAEYQINRTWEVFSSDSLFKHEAAFLFGISAKDRKQSAEEYSFVKQIRPSLKTKLDIDFPKLDSNPVTLLAFYEVNKLFGDHIFQLYKIEMSKEELILDEFLSAYLARTKAKYSLEEYMTK